MKKYCCLFAVLLLAACAHHDKPVPDTVGRFSINDDGTAKVSGLVAANRNDCASGDPCYVTLNLVERTVHVIYRYGSGACESAEAAHDAQTLKAGDRIHAAGRYSRDDAIGVVDVCAGRGGYIDKDKP